MNEHIDQVKKVKEINLHLPVLDNTTASLTAEELSRMLFARDLAGKNIAEYLR